MPNAIVKFLLPLLVLSVAIPESEAKRMGGGRSTGRQVQGVKKTAPPAARSVRPVRPQQTPPAANRQPAPDERIAGRQAVPQQAPSAPTHALPNQAASPWGGMLGGALLGLGLGSMMSRDGNAANQPERQGQSSGSSGDSGSEGSSGASGDYANTPAATQAAPEANRQTAGVFRTFLPIGLLALIIFFTIRRMRRRNL